MYSHLLLSVGPLSERPLPLATELGLNTVQSIWGPVQPWQSFSLRTVRKGGPGCGLFATSEQPLPSPPIPELCLLGFRGLQRWVAATLLTQPEEECVNWVFPVVGTEATICVLLGGTWAVPRGKGRHVSCVCMLRIVSDLLPENSVRRRGGLLSVAPTGHACAPHGVLTSVFIM